MWRVVNKAGEELRITLEEIFQDTSYELGVDPGPGQGRRRGAPAGAARRARRRRCGEGFTLVRREYTTAIGPVDLLCRDAAGAHGGGRGQAARRDRRRRAAHPLPGAARTAIRCSPRCSGVFAAQEIKPQARVLAAGPRHPLRGASTTTRLRGIERDELTLF